MDGPKPRASQETPLTVCNVLPLRVATNPQMSNSVLVQLHRRRLTLGHRLRWTKVTMAITERKPPPPLSAYVTCGTWNLRPCFAVPMLAAPSATLLPWCAAPMARCFHGALLPWCAAPMLRGETCPTLCNCSYRSHVRRRLRLPPVPEAAHAEAAPAGAQAYDRGARFRARTQLGMRCSMFRCFALSEPDSGVCCCRTRSSQMGTSVSSDRVRG